MRIKITRSTKIEEDFYTGEGPELATAAGRAAQGEPEGGEGGAQPYVASAAEEEGLEGKNEE